MAETACSNELWLDRISVASCGRSRLTCCTSSMPSIPGRSMSLTIRSQLRPLMISNASSALVVQRTSPRLPSSSTSSVPTTSSSSTRRMRARRTSVTSPSSLKGSCANHVSLTGVSLVPSYVAPARDRAGKRIRGRSWTYDSALTATALAVRGDLERAGAILDRLQELQRTDGALEGSYDLAGGDPAGPVRSGNQAWVGLAALAWRAATGSERHERLLAGLAGWLLAQRDDHGLVRGGPDVAWASTEHNLEARALFAALGAADVVAQMDEAIDAELFAGDHFRQGRGDDARPLDVQAYGILWLLGRGRHEDAAAVERTTDATMRVDGRRVLWPGAAGQTFSGYRPF